MASDIVLGYLMMRNFSSDDCNRNVPSLDIPLKWK